MSTEELRELLSLLREFGVTDYADQRVSLRVPGSPQVASAAPEDIREERLTEAQQRVRRDLERLPEGYQRMFEV